MYGVCYKWRIVSGSYSSERHSSLSSTWRWRISRVNGTNVSSDWKRHWRRVASRLNSDSSKSGSLKKKLPSLWRHSKKRQPRLYLVYFCSRLAAERFYLRILTNCAFVPIITDHGSFLTFFRHIVIQLWHLVSRNLLYTQGQAFALEDIVLQFHKVF